MSARDRILDLLPPPYAVRGDSVLAGILERFCIEMDVLLEDVDRLRQSHWVGTAFRMQDLERIGQLVGVASLPWEALPAFRARLLALVAALRRGAVGPGDIRRFVFDYLSRIEDTLDATMVPGLSGRKGIAEAFRPGAADNPPNRYRPLELIENPERLRSSDALAKTGGRVPFLSRWEERQGGLDDTVPTFRLAGYSGGRTVVPILANFTTGEFIGYRGVVPLGRTLEIAPSVAQGEGDDPRRLVTGLLDGNDVTDRLFSTARFTPGVPFTPADLDAAPRMPRLRRGASSWAFLSAGLFDVRGLDRFLFAMAGESPRQGAFDETSFGDALFATGPVARLEMTWFEREPAAFEVRVPRHLVAEPVAGVSTDAQAGAPVPRPLHAQVADGLRDAVGRLRAAGVCADVRFVPFVERHEQAIRVQLPWVVLVPELAPAGTGDRLDVGGLFGETPLGGSRFE